MGIILGLFLVSMSQMKAQLSAIMVELMALVHTVTILGFPAWLPSSQGPVSSLLLEMFRYILKRGSRTGIVHTKVRLFFFELFKHPTSQPTEDFSLIHME